MSESIKPLRWLIWSLCELGAVKSVAGGGAAGGESQLKPYAFSAEMLNNQTVERFTDSRITEFTEVATFGEPGLVNGVWTVPQSGTYILIVKLRCNTNTNDQSLQLRIERSRNGSTRGLNIGKVLDVPYKQFTDFYCSQTALLEKGDEISLYVFHRCSIPVQVSYFSTWMAFGI